MTSVEEAAQTSDRQSPLVTAAQRLVVRIEMLVDEVTRLRADNVVLRREVREAVAMLDGAGTVAGGAAHGRGAKSVIPPDGRRKRRTRGRAPKGRATPAEVTSDVVRAVLIKLGESTASEIAAEINRARAQSTTGARSESVGGRAVRFLAERAGATTTVGDDGQRRYRFG